MKPKPKKPPIVTGQRGEILRLIREHGQIVSFGLTAERAMPGAFSRISELRRLGFNIIVTILDEFEFRGRIRRNVARYSLGVPEWKQPEPQAEEDFLTSKENK